MEFNKLERERHIAFMRAILEEIEKRKVPAYLKGGTALLLAHDLDRFSEDIDLNAEKKFNLESIIKDAAQKENIKDLHIKVVKDFEKDVDMLDKASEKIALLEKMVRMKDAQKTIEKERDKKEERGLEK